MSVWSRDTTENEAGRIQARYRADEVRMHDVVLHRDDTGATSAANTEF